MKIEDFFLKWNGIGCDFDGVYGFQCVDIFKQFQKDVVGGEITNGNAIDIINKYPHDLYDFIGNLPDNFPQKGDVVLWTNGIGQFGHIAICFYGDKNHFISFDQNYPIGSLCHFQSHNYSNIAGWLRPKNQENINPTPQLTITDQTVIPQLNMEVQAIVSSIADSKKHILDLTKSLEECENKPQMVTTNTVYVPKPEVSNVPTWLRRLFGDHV